MGGRWIPDSLSRLWRLRQSQSGRPGYWRCVGARGPGRQLHAGTGCGAVGWAIALAGRLLGQRHWLPLRRQRRTGRLMKKGALMFAGTHRLLIGMLAVG